MPRQPPHISFTSTEVNILIHSYLLDAGFTQTANTFYSEARFQENPDAIRPAPRKQLIELLAKALAYVEAFTHRDKAHGREVCVAPFGLIHPHVCVVVDVQVEDTGAPRAERNASLPVPTPPQEQEVEENNLKRRERSTTPSPSPAKRQKTTSGETVPEDVTDIEVDSSDVVADKTQHDELRDPLPSDHETALQSEAPTELLDPATVQSPAEAKARPDAPPGVDVVSDNDVLVLEGHTTQVYFVAWNPAFPDILATGQDTIARIWALPPSHSPGRGPLVLKHEHRAPNVAIADIAWNPDGTLLATAGDDGICRVYTTSGDLYLILSHGLGLACIQWSGSGQRLLTGGVDGVVNCWKLDSNQPLHTFRPHAGTGSILDLEFIGEDAFASASSDRLIIETKISSQPSSRKLRGHTDEVNRVLLSPSGLLLASCSDDCTARVWDLTTPWEAFVAERDMFSTSVGCKFVLRGHSNSVIALSWRTPEYILTGAHDSTIRLWGADSGTCLRVITNLQKLNCCDFSPDGNYLAAGSEDGKLRIFDAHTGKLKKTWSNGASKGRGAIFELQWYKDGNKIAVALQNKRAASITVGPL